MKKIGVKHFCLENLQIENYTLSTCNQIFVKLLKLWLNHQVLVYFEGYLLYFRCV